MAGVLTFTTLLAECLTGSNVWVAEVTDTEQITMSEKATTNYNDGSTKEFPIIWDEVSLNQPEYPDILVPQRADPRATKDDDRYYYFTGSYPVCGTVEENQGIVLYR